jgi:transcriptional regulator with GAF, ATPase, and Fis domain
MFLAPDADHSYVGVYMPAATDIDKSQEGTPQAVPAWRSMIVGASPAIVQVVNMIAMIATRRTTVLISGETGCGKEVVARAIHLASPRAGRPFIPVSCAAIPRDLLETELFGQVQGAFTAATPARLGYFEQAHGGSLLLDEIGDLALDLQAKLLRVLQEREFHRVGSSQTIEADVRVLAATNVDLLTRVKQGKFREDLYYRLHVMPLRVSPLRERRSDIPLLVAHFVRTICTRENLPLKTLQPGVLDYLTSYSWPGNVRELENALEMAIVVSGDRTELFKSDFSLAHGAVQETIEMTPEQLVKLPEEGIDFEAAIARIELDLLVQALRRSNGNKKLAADILKLKRTTLAAKLKSLEEFSGESANSQSDVDMPVSVPPGMTFRSPTI